MRRFNVVCRLILALSLAAPPMAFGQCSPPGTTPTTRLSSGSCGSSVWQLGYVWMGSTYIRSSNYSPAGSCGGNYYDCNCEYIGSYNVEGSVEGVVIQSGNGYEVSWTAINYNTIYHDVPCSSSSVCCNNATDTPATTFTLKDIDQVFLTC